MQKDSRIFDDFARMASGAFGTLADMKREMESIVNAKVEKLLDKMHLVRREEFEVVRLMAEQARVKQEETLKKLADLEKMLDSQESHGKAPVKPSRK